jgi:hypothetical protein
MEKFMTTSIAACLREIRIVSNLSRQKMLVSTICAMIETRSVVLSELATKLNDEVKTDSNETRLRDFFREVAFDYEALASFIVAFLDKQPGTKVRLTVDRTNWKFGTKSINILMFIASQGSYSVPLYWELLENKGGNSSQEQRIDLFKKCIKLLGEERIGLVLGDREFIGHTWLKYLKDKKIRFCVRMPKSHIIHRKDRESLLAESVWEKHKKATDRTRIPHCTVDNVEGNVLITTDAKGKLLYLFGTANVDYLDQYYQKRWTIETLFQSFKSRGFDLEKTHMKHNERLKKLIGVVTMAFTFCISAGQFKHDNDKQIQVKNHKRKAKSLFRYGLDFIREAFKVNYKYQQQWLDLFTRFIKSIFTNISFSDT